LKYLKRSDDVQVGDLIVTSGMNNIFPKGFPIGTVLSIEKSQYGMTQEVELKPVVDLTNLEEVFIVLNAATGPVRETGL
jgi:rod shape-determining protein MreC